MRRRCEGNGQQGMERDLGTGRFPQSGKRVLGVQLLLEFKGDLTID